MKVTIPNWIVALLPQNKKKRKITEDDSVPYFAFFAVLITVFVLFIGGAILFFALDSPTPKQEIAPPQIVASQLQTVAPVSSDVINLITSNMSWFTMLFMAIILWKPIRMITRSI